MTTRIPMTGAKGGYFVPPRWLVQCMFCDAQLDLCGPRPDNRPFTTEAGYACLDCQDHKPLSERTP